MNFMDEDEGRVDISRDDYITLKEYIDTLKEYNDLLVRILDGNMAFLFVHGISLKDEDIKKSKELRDKIKDCEDFLNGCYGL
jgi:hypothetical protein